MKGDVVVIWTYMLTFNVFLFPFFKSNIEGDNYLILVIILENIGS